MSAMHTVALAVVLAVAATAAADDDASPHRNTDMCAVCHNDDMTLQRSERETCTFCHAETLHSGASEHLRLDAARIARSLPAPAKDAPVLPLTDDGRMWCGTCHLFHDPSLGEDWLPNGWIPPNDGLPKAVRDSVTARWDAFAKAHGEQKVDAAFAAEGTRALRLPVQNGALCAHCHGSLR